VKTMMFWYGGHWAIWQAGLMWVGMLVFLGLLIWGIYAVVTAATRKPRGQERGDEGTPDPRRILDERLARGDIDSDEYSRLRGLIESDRNMSRAGSDGSS
jgi:putative membrane protein